MKAKKASQATIGQNRTIGDRFNKRISPMKITPYNVRLVLAVTSILVGCVAAVAVFYEEKVSASTSLMIVFYLLYAAHQYRRHRKERVLLDNGSSVSHR